MAVIARKSDGRRIFTDAFKRKHLGRVERGELTLAALSRKLGIAPSLLHRWKRLMPQGSLAPVALRARELSAREMGAAQYIRELQLLVGKQTVELEFLRTELSELKKRPPRAPSS